MFSLTACDIPDPIYNVDDDVCLKYYNIRIRILDSIYIGDVNDVYYYTTLSSAGTKEVLPESLIIYCE